MRVSGVLLLTALIFQAGCIDAVSQPQGSAASDPATSSAPSGTNETSSPSPGTGPSTSPTGGGGGGGGGSGGGTEPDPEPETDPGWPSVNQATIRPGVQVVAAGAQCTSNFLFRSPNNTTLYLGLAAHCVDDIDVGDSVTIQGSSNGGQLAYSSWKACPSCSEDLDFALIALDPDDRAKVHPALRHFGGPTALKDSSDLGLGDKVMVYGNSGLWPNVEPIRWHEGVVTIFGTTETFEIATAAPGIPGDSGSPVITKDGQAAGILATLCLYPCTGQNGVVRLDYALEKAGDEIDVELVTWELIDPGLL